MSQRMEYEEGGGNYQGGYSTAGSQQNQGVNFDDHFGGFSGQKIGQISGRTPSPGQRLALAIVSLVALVALTAIILGITIAGIGGFMGLTGGLIALAIVSAAVFAINAVFAHGN